MKVGRSKTGLPTIMESGGGSTNTGSAQIVAGANGEKVKPLFIPRGYSNGDHAIFVVRPGMLLIDASHDRQGDRITVRRIIGVEKESEELLLEVIGEEENGDGNIDSHYADAAKAALNKAHCYHCHEAHYVIE